MKNWKTIISFLLLIVTLSVCQEPSITSTDSTSNRTHRTINPRSGGAGVGDCGNSWDDAGTAANGDEICEEDFKYDEYGCVEPNKKLEGHKGKREFGQRCDGSGGAEECLLLARSTEWRWKNFTNHRVNVIVGDCSRRTNLVCHGYYNRCYCSTRKYPGEYYQYDRGQKVCVIRPGFPCENEYDCTNGTICSNIYVSEDNWQKVCNCDYRLDFEPWYVNSTYWDNWFCTEDVDTEVKSKPKPRRKVLFHFNSKEYHRLNNNATPIFSSIIFQAFNLATVWLLSNSNNG